MPKFTTEADILKYAQSLVKKSQSTQNSNVRKTVGDTVSRKVESEVYTKYSPHEYERRGRNGGLADERNVEVVSVYSSGNITQVVLENLTEGNDSMKGKPIDSMIQDGEGGNWNDPYGVWTEAREYSSKVIEELNGGSQLRDSLVRDLQKIGLDAK